MNTFNIHEAKTQLTPRRPCFAWRVIRHRQGRQAARRYRRSMRRQNHSDSASSGRDRGAEDFDRMGEKRSRRCLERVREATSRHAALVVGRRSTSAFAAARRQINNAKNELIFSAASLWEVTIKNSLGRQIFASSCGCCAAHCSTTVTSSCRSPASTRSRRYAPPAAQDPFDRLLIAQALFEGITLLIADSQVAQYRGPVRKV